MDVQNLIQMRLSKHEIIAKRNKYFPWVGNGMGYHASSFCACKDACFDPEGWPWGENKPLLADTMVHPTCEGGLHIPGYAYPAFYFAQGDDGEPIYPVLDGLLDVGGRIFDLSNPDDYNISKEGIGIVKPNLYGWVDDEGRYWSMGGGIRRVEHLPDVVIYPDYGGWGSEPAEIPVIYIPKEHNGISDRTEAGRLSMSTPDKLIKAGTTLAEILNKPEIALEKGLFCCGTAYPLGWLLDDYIDSLQRGFVNGIYPNTPPDTFYGIYGISVSTSHHTAPNNTTPDESWTLPTPTIETTITGNEVTLVANGNNIVYSLWQIGTENGWENLSCVLGTSCTVSLATGTHNIRCVVIGAGTSCISGTVEIGVTDIMPTVTITATATTTTKGKPVTITANATNTINYQWEMSTNTLNWANIEGANSPTYEAPCDTAGKYYYRCTVNGVVTSVTSDSIEINVVNAPTVTIAASRTETEIGTAVTLTATAANQNSLQWQSSSDGSNWSNINGATSSTYSVPVTSAGTKQYRCVAKGSVTTKNSDSVTIVVRGHPTITISASKTSTEVGSSVTFTATATDAKSYQWQIAPSDDQV